MESWRTKHRIGQEDTEPEAEQVCLSRFSGGQLIKSNQKRTVYFSQLLCFSHKTLFQNVHTKLSTGCLDTRSLEI